MKQVRFLFLVLAGLLLTRMQAQNLPDSLARVLRTDSLRIYRRTAAKLFLKVENRNSFVSREGINLFGFMAGATFYESHTFFLGYFFLDPRNKNPISPQGWTTTVQHFLNMRYGVIGYQYVLHKSRYLQINTPLALGYGRYQVERKTETGTALSTAEGNMVPTSAGVQVILKPLEWVAFSVSGGYRYIGQQENTDLSLRGFYYAIGIWLDGRFLRRHFQYTYKKRHYQRLLRES